MSDLALITTKGDPNYGDIQFLNGDLVLLDSADPIQGPQEILQNVMINLRIFLGEWFMDNTLGVPWFQQILVKNPDQGAIDAIIIKTITDTPGIIQLISYSSTIDTASRGMTIQFKAQTTSGTVNYNGLVNPTVQT
jgi:hypothetical protein